MYLLWFLVVPLSVLGCSEELLPEDSVEDTDPVVDEDPDTGCEVVEVGWDGPDPPVVGDSWTVWPICDGAVVMGATVVRVDPVEAATIDENVLTFAQAGACDISVQVGSEKATITVEVSKG